MGRLSDLPFYGAYNERRRQIQDEGMDELKQVGVLSQLAAQRQAMDVQRQTLAEKQVAAQRAEQYRAAVAALGPNPTQDQLVSVASQFGGADKVMDVHQKSLDRQATTAATAATAAERVAAGREAAAARAEQAAQNATMMHEFRLSQARTAEERAAETARHNRAMEGIQGQLAALRGEASGRSKPPPGYRATTDGNLEAIPGGPADTKLQGAFNQDNATLSSTEASMDRLATAANEVMRHPGLGRITGLAGALPNVPGMAGANAAAKLQTLKAQVGFGVLQDMRNASKTGGALGAITEKELVFLQNALAALDNAQDEAQMKESLQKIIDFAAESKGRLRNAFNLKHSARQPGAAPTPSTPPGPTPPREEKKVLNGKTYVKRNGQWFEE